MTITTKITAGYAADFEFDMDEKEKMMDNLSLKNIYVSESLLSSSVTFMITFTDRTHALKNYFNYKIKSGSPVKIKQLKIYNPYSGKVPTSSGYDVPTETNEELILKDYVVYRMSGRSPINYHMEDFTLYLCPEFVFKNFKRRISEFYSNASLNDIVSDAMQALEIKKKDIANPDNLKRNYMANNQHPLQIIEDISEIAYKQSQSGQWAFFLHYMTTEDEYGKNYWKPLVQLIKDQGISKVYKYHEKGLNRQLSSDDGIMDFEFPCDFDTLLDITSGIIDNGGDYENHKPSMISINPFTSTVFVVDGKSQDKKTKGIGGSLNAGAWTNLNTIGDKATEVEKWFHKRNEPLSFLHRENVNLKILVPFNPNMHVGKKITVEFYSKLERGSKDFGSGDYLVVHMTHNIKVGELATSTYECIKVGNHPLEDKRPEHQIPEKVCR